MIKWIISLLAAGVLFILATPYMDNPRATDGRTRLDLRALKKGWRPNQAFTRVEWPMTPDAAMARVKAALGQEPRVTILRDEARRIDYVQRSKLFRFPDHVSVEVAPLAAGGSEVLVYSRSRYGIRDFGVNAARIKRLLRAAAPD